MRAFTAFLCSATKCLDPESSGSYVVNVGIPPPPSRLWPSAALAAEAADDRPRASMIAAPRLPTVGRNTSLFQTSSLIIAFTFWPAIVAKR